MKQTPKEVLLQTAAETVYYELPFGQLEALWNMSNDFVEHGRLQALEPEWYAILEQHFFLSLLTCRDQVAKLMLQRIMDQYGPNGRRVVKLRTAYVRATQEEALVEKHLESLAEFELDSFKIGLVDLKAKGKWPQYIDKLVRFLDELNPVDAEAWAELAEAYVETGHFDDAVRSYEQVLLIVPYAYNVFARIGEIQHLQAGNLSGGMAVALNQMLDACAHLCRSVELCPTYLRGWCGLYVVASKVAQLNGGKGGNEHERLAARARTEMAKAVAEDGKSRQNRPQDLAAAKKLLST